MILRTTGKKPSGNERVDSTLTRNGGLSYLEIPAIDVKRSAAFYKKILGWKIHGEKTVEPKFMDQGRHLLGRWVKLRSASRKPGWLPYFYVDGIQIAVKRVAAAGGEIVKVPFAEGNLLIAIVRDPAGNLLGLWQESGR